MAMYLHSLEWLNTIFDINQEKNMFQYYPFFIQMQKYHLGECYFCSLI